MPSEILSQELSWIWKSILLFIVGGVIVLVTSFYLARGIDVTASTENSIPVKILFSQCATHSENFGNSLRYYPGIIDLSKFENLKDCLLSQNIGANITVYDLKNNLIKNTIANEKLFRDLNPFCDIENKQFECFSHKDYILIKDNNELRSAVISIEEVVKK